MSNPAPNLNDSLKTLSITLTDTIAALERQAFIIRVNNPDSPQLYFCERDLADAQELLTRTNARLSGEVVDPAHTPATYPAGTSLWLANGRH